MSDKAIRPQGRAPRAGVALAVLLVAIPAGCGGDDSGEADAAESPWDAGETIDSSVETADALAADANPSMAARIGFQYLGSDGASQYLDDVLVVDGTATTVLDEGFEGGEVPAGWGRAINSLYSWEIVDSATEAHAGSYSAKVTWYQDQNEWLITPSLGPSGSWTVTFWTRGSVDLAEAATLHVSTRCDDGGDWVERYVFPGEGVENFVWHQETIEFSCP